MRNSILQLAASLLTSSLLIAPAASQQPAQQRTNADYTEYICGPSATDIARAREYLKKNPQSELAKHFEQMILNHIALKFHNDLQSYYRAADADKLSQIIANGEELLSAWPDHPYVIAHLAIAIDVGVRSGFYQDNEKSKAYTERAIKILVLRAANTPRVRLVVVFQPRSGSHLSRAAAQDL